MLSYYADANPKNLYKRTELLKVNDVFDHLKSRPSLVERMYFHFTSSLVIDTQVSTHISTYSHILHLCRIFTCHAKCLGEIFDV